LFAPGGRSVRGRTYVWVHGADFGDGPAQRVQVRTTTYYRDRRWCVAVCTRGGNQSWNGLVKRFSHERCDWLFVLVGDGRRWCMPADRVAAGNAIKLGGPKYADFVIEPGRPLMTSVAA
jgi:hypothetical protein